MNEYHVYTWHIHVSATALTMQLMLPLEPQEQQGDVTSDTSAFRPPATEENKEVSGAKTGLGNNVQLDLGV